MTTDSLRINGDVLAQQMADESREARTIDVWFCTCANDPIRNAIAEACWQRWKLERDIRLHRITPESIDCTRRQFQGFRRTWAEIHSTNNPYIVCDDDCMPLGPLFVARGLAVFNTHPDVGVMATRNITEPRESEEIVDVTTGGGINWMRKGIISDNLPPRNHDLYDDSPMGADIRAAGYRVVRASELLMNHYGWRLGTLVDDYKSGITQLADCH